MTTTITVQAHCDADTEVAISVADKHGEAPHVLQDGEETTVYVYDERSVTVQERAKTD